MSDNPTTDPQPYMHAEYLAEVCKAYPTAGALIAWQQQEIERLRGLLWAILAADERGQGVNYSEAMNAAAKAINYVS